MKKVWIGILLGIMLQKGIAGIYSYMWWTADYKCRIVKKQYSEKCIDGQVGNWIILNYILYEPSYSWRKWNLEN